MASQLLVASSSKVDRNPISSAIEMVTRVATNILLTSRKCSEHCNSSGVVISSSRVAGVIMAGRDSLPQPKHRKRSTKAANRIFWTRRILICILIFSIKIMGSAGNAIRNNDQGTIINGTSSTGIGDLSISRAQQQPNLGRVNQTERRFATDANDVTMTRGGGEGGGGGGGVSERISVVIGSALGRAATYSYFYIGRKLMYVPLFFLLYWTIYNMALLLQSIASRWVSELGVPGKPHFGMSSRCGHKYFQSFRIWEQKRRCVIYLCRKQLINNIYFPSLSAPRAPTLARGTTCKGRSTEEEEEEKRSCL